MLASCKNYYFKSLKVSKQSKKYRVSHLTNFSNGVEWDCLNVINQVAHSTRFLLERMHRMLGLGDWLPVVVQVQHVKETWVFSRFRMTFGQIVFMDLFESTDIRASVSKSMLVEFSLFLAID